MLTPAETGTLVGLLIRQAQELVDTDQRAAGKKLHAAEELLAQLQEDIDNIRKSGPDILQRVTDNMVGTKSKLTVKEFERQNKGLKSAAKRNKQSGIPAGINNYN